LDLPSLIEEALSVQSSDFIEIVEKATFLLKQEDGQIGNLTIINRLVKLEPLGEALVIGDLHGDIESLTFILQTSRFLKKMEKAKDATMIFLGDYGDRGEKSPEIYYLILKLKLTYPKQVVLLRGNHEAPKDLLGEPHDLPNQFQHRFGEDWQATYAEIRELHACLYNAVYVPDRYLMVHGGLSPEIRSIQDIAVAQENQNEALLEELLWNDPDEELQDVSFSPRGIGKLFGKKVTEEVLRRLQLKILIRGHEANNEGFKINHKGKVLTLFSRKGAPYYNRYGAYLQVPLEEKFENAQQLNPFIHKF
jgi:diadenosine tetraphosphatase ApaH/serine/threonine PP2A family protein phosphatase